jgi:hypothetical protein
MARKKYKGTDPRREGIYDIAKGETIIIKSEAEQRKRPQANPL